MKPDLERFRFDGTAEITLESESAIDEVVLNAIDLNFLTCGIRREQSLAPCSLSLDLNKEELIIRLPGAIHGRFELVITYQGRINDSMAGFYRSGYVDRGIRRLSP